MKNKTKPPTEEEQTTYMGHLLQAIYSTGIKKKTKKSKKKAPAQKEEKYIPEDSVTAEEVIYNLIHKPIGNPDLQRCWMCYTTKPHNCFKREKICFSCEEYFSEEEMENRIKENK